MTKAGVPADAQAFREKWRIARALLDEMKPQLPAYQAIVFDAGYGVVQPLLAELEKRQEPYVAQVPGNIAAWPAEAVATLNPARRGRPRQQAIVRDPVMHPLCMIGWRDKLSPGTEAVGAGATATGRRCQRPGGGRAGAGLPARQSLAATRRSPLADDRAAQRGHLQILFVQPSGRHSAGGVGPAGAPALGHRTGLSTIKGRTRVRPLRGLFLAGAAPSSHAVLPRVLFADQTAVVKKNDPRCLKSAAGSWRRWPFAPARTVRPALHAPGSSSIHRSLYLTE